MILTRWNRAAALAAAGMMAVALAACGGNEAGDDQADATSQASASPSETAAAAGQFGAGCAAIPKDGEGSFQGMADDPVATAASNNPALSTLVTAVTQAGLVDTLNGLPSATVFAPSNDAFAKIPKADLDKVLADKATLTKILTYHVVGGEKMGPDTLGTAGPYKTVQGAELKVTGSGEDFTVGPQDAKVVCGNVQTANATVYIIDTVMMPPA